METEQAFWVIWNPDNRNPVKRHAYLREARIEAERLAAANPGQTFYVLRSVGKATTTRVVYTEIGKGGLNG